MMTTRRGGQQLEPWLAVVEAEDQADQSDLRSFGRHPSPTKVQSPPG
jgi:hypothetical protein